MFVSVLPSTSTAFELSVEEATDFISEIEPAIDEIHGLKYARPLNVTVAPWLVYEYGLGPISQFFVTVEDAIDQGRAWQKLRGTPAALTTSLSWIGYGTITIDDQVTGRARWHLYQINMGELPGEDEVTRLNNAEYLAGLSDPARSFFWRGYYGYDVRGHVWGRSRTGRTMWGDSSGVRLPDGKTKWSHGRAHALTSAGADADRIALGVNYVDGATLTWEVPITWATPGVSWSGATNARLLKSWLMRQKSAHIVLLDSLGAEIGYASVLRAVVDATDYLSVGTTVTLTYEAATKWGTSNDSVASVALSFGGVASGVRPYEPWLEPDQISFPDGETRISAGALAITLFDTVRESIVINLTI